MTVQEEIQDANIQDAIHCVKVELEEEVCEECRFHRLCHIWCKDVSRIKLKALEKQIPSEEKPIMRDSLGRCKMRGCNLCDGYREELEQYRALGTVEELKEAREKQIPKKPHKYIAFDGIERNGCPRCYEELGRNEILYAGQKYCSVCGQALKRR